MNHAAVLLVGTGVVGRAILKCHIDAGLSVTVADQDADSVREAVDLLTLPKDRWERSDVSLLGESLYAVTLSCLDDLRAEDDAAVNIVIESITERLEAKQQFFAATEKLFPPAVLCTNTSTLRVGDIAAALVQPDQLCGMHFFMPVHRRPAVEVIASPHTSEQSIQVCREHVVRIGKRPLEVADGPGFVVNRMLSPYLNQAMLLVTQGATPEQIERVAMDYGMPMSPLELIDWIGARTAFDAGRVYWQAFPGRIDPAPLIAAMVKQDRLGRCNNAGFYNYSGAKRSTDVAPEVLAMCDRYSRRQLKVTDQDVGDLLTIPMWIEAACVLQGRIVASADSIEAAMSGGLGYIHDGKWFDFYDELGMQRIRTAISKWSGTYRAMKPPPTFAASLEVASSPREAIERLIPGVFKH